MDYNCTHMLDKLYMYCVNKKFRKFNDYIKFGACIDNNFDLILGVLCVVCVYCAI